MSEPRWWLLWKLYGLPRCSQVAYPGTAAPHCWRLIWPWQEREIRNGAAVHVKCLYEAQPSGMPRGLEYQPQEHSMVWRMGDPAMTQPDLRTVTREQLVELLWQANSDQGWGDAIDTINRMADAAYAAALLDEPPLRTLVDRARAEMENRYDDLRWCRKLDQCHIKAEGARLAIDDFDSILQATLGAPDAQS